MPAYKRSITISIPNGDSGQGLSISRTLPSSGFRPILEVLAVMLCAGFLAVSSQLAAPVTAGLSINPRTVVLTPILTQLFTATGGSGGSAPKLLSGKSAGVRWRESRQSPSHRTRRKPNIVSGFSDCGSSYSHLSALVGSLLF